MRERWRYFYIGHGELGESAQPPPSPQLTGGELTPSSPPYKKPHSATPHPTRPSSSAVAAAAMPTAAPSPRQVHVEAVQTVIPKDMAPPGQARKISLPENLTSSALNSHLRVVLFFGKKAGLDSWRVAAQIKESLGVALSLDHLFAGRLRPHGGGLELRLNDAGVRLVQAKADFAMAEVEREIVEAHLCYWADVDEEKPHFSALFYIQVTGFLDGRFSIGLSCSLLLADPLILANFLHKWAKVHAEMEAHGQFQSAEFFNLEAFKKPEGGGYLKSMPVVGSSTASKTIVFEGVGGAAAAVEEAARRIGESLEGEFLVIVYESDRMSELKFVECKREEVKEGVWRSAEDWLGVGGLLLAGGTSPVEVSWGVVAERPLVVVMPPPNGGDDGHGMISVTFPKTG